MESAIEPTLEQKAAIRIHFVQRAFDHLPEIDARTGTLLFKNGLLKSHEPFANDDLVASIVEDSTHPLRLRLPSGLAVAHYDTIEKQAISCVPTSFLLLSQNPKLRAAAMKHLNSVIKEMGDNCTPKLRGLAQTNLEDLLSDDPNRWTTTALTVFDVVSDDFLLNLATFKQYQMLNHKEGLDEYVTKITVSVSGKC